MIKFRTRNNRLPVEVGFGQISTMRTEYVNYVTPTVLEMNFTIF